MVYGACGWCMAYGVWCINTPYTIHHTPYTIHILSVGVVFGSPSLLNITSCMVFVWCTVYYVRRTLKGVQCMCIASPLPSMHHTPHTDHKPYTIQQTPYTKHHTPYTSTAFNSLGSMSEYTGRAPVWHSVCGVMM